MPFLDETANQKMDDPLNPAIIVGRHWQHGVRGDSELHFDREVAFSPEPTVVLQTFLAVDTERFPSVAEKREVVSVEYTSPSS